MIYFAGVILLPQAGHLLQTCLGSFLCISSFLGAFAPVTVQPSEPLHPSHSQLSLPPVSAVPVFCLTDPFLEGSGSALGAGDAAVSQL